MRLQTRCVDCPFWLPVLIAGVGADVPRNLVLCDVGSLSPRDSRRAQRGDDHTFLYVAVVGGPKASDRGSPGEMVDPCHSRLLRKDPLATRPTPRHVRSAIDRRLCSMSVAMCSETSALPNVISVERVLK